MSGVIVHEWLEPHGGAEKVVEQFAEIFPTAPITALWNDAPGRFPAARVTETWLARTPLRRRKVLAVPFMPATWRNLGASDAEWILCSSHLFAHHAKFSGRAATAPKFVYAYTPARYIWNPELDSRGQHPAVKIASRPLRKLDRARAREAKSIAAVSNFVRDRIQNTWFRDSEVIYPPVEVGHFTRDVFDLTPEEHETLDSLPDTFVLGASRFIPYKRLDQVIDVGIAADVAVVLAGGGPEFPALIAKAAEHPGRVTFISNPSQGLLGELYRRCLAYVFPAVEDFGIMPVEAMAAGAAVIARDIGGASETVIDGTTGVLLHDFDTSSIRAAVEKASTLDPAASRLRAFDFDESVFRQRVKDWITP